MSFAVEVGLVLAYAFDMRNRVSARWLSVRMLGTGLVAMCLFAASGCGTSYSSTRVADPVLIARSSAPSEVRAAIVRAMEARRFTPKSEEPGRIVARLDRGSQKLDVAIEYSGTQYVVRYLDSAGLKSKAGPDGDVLVDEHWSGWVKGLRARIGEELLVPAKEAAETARRERDYQLLIEQHRTAQAQANANANANANASQSGDPNGGAPAAPGQLVIQPVIPIPLPQLPNGGLNLNRSSTSGSQSITCCINGAFYVCPSQVAFKKCMSLGPNECTRDASRSCK